MHRNNEASGPEPLDDAAAVHDRWRRDYIGGASTVVIQGGAIRRHGGERLELAVRDIF